MEHREREPLPEPHILIGVEVPAAFVGFFAALDFLLVRCLVLVVEGKERALGNEFEVKRAAGDDDGADLERSRETREVAVFPTGPELRFGHKEFRSYGVTSYFNPLVRWLQTSQVKNGALPKPQMREFVR